MTDNAEQWHIPPAGDDQPNMFNTGKLPRDPGCDHFALLPKQPTVIATHVVDLAPVVAFFREELQRLRGQLAVERGAASSAREALAACEGRARLLAEERDDAKEAQRILMDARMAETRAQFEQAKTVPPGLVPGSVEAVIEAYRLLAGKEPVWRDDSWKRNYEMSSPCLQWSTLLEATDQMLAWLDIKAPGGRP